MIPSNVIGILALAASAAATIAGFLDGVNPKLALIVAGVGAAIAAFTDKITGKKEQ